MHLVTKVVGMGNILVMFIYIIFVHEPNNFNFVLFLCYRGKILKTKLAIQTI